MTLLSEGMRHAWRLSPLSHTGGGQASIEGNEVLVSALWLAGCFQCTANDSCHGSAAGRSVAATVVGHTRTLWAHANVRLPTPRASLGEAVARDVLTDGCESRCWSRCRNERSQRSAIRKQTRPFPCLVRSRRSLSYLRRKVGAHELGRDRRPWAQWLPDWGDFQRTGVEGADKGQHARGCQDLRGGGEEQALVGSGADQTPGERVGLYSTAVPRMPRLVSCPKKWGLHLTVLPRGYCAMSEPVPATRNHRSRPVHGARTVLGETWR